MGPFPLDTLIMASSESLRQLHGEGMDPLVVLRGCGGWDSNKKTPYSGHSCGGFESRPGQSHAGPNLTWGQGDWKQSKRNRTQLRINVSSQRRQGPTWGSRSLPALADRLDEGLRSIRGSHFSHLGSRGGHSTSPITPLACRRGKSCIESFRIMTNE